MRKRIFCLMMAAALSLGTALPVLAEDHVSSKNWQVTFDGSKMASNVSPSEMAEEISSIQPGDTMRLQIALKNSGGRATGWYMTNKVIETLEDQVEAASGGAYTYVLTYTDPQGAEDILFSNEALGGEDAPRAAGEGLKQGTGSLEDYFFLDTLENGESGKVFLTVGLDGESQGNDYQDTLARLQMNFAVENDARSTEVTVTPTPRTVTNTVRRVLDQTTHITDEGTPLAVLARSVQTNDPTLILPYCAAALAAGIVLLFLGIMSLKRRDRETAGADEEGGSQG